MKIAACVLLAGVLAIPSLADTLSFNDHGSIIDGTVTFSKGLFRIKAQSGGETQEIEVAPHRVGVIQFNKAGDDHSFGRVLHDPPDPNVSTLVDVQFWDSAKKELHAVPLEEVSPDSVKVAGKTIKKAEIRQIKIAQQ